MPGSHPSFLAVLNLHLFSLLTLLLFLRIMGSKSQSMNVVFQLSYCQTCSGCPAALGALPAPVANKPWISTAVLNTMILYRSQIRHGIGRQGFEFESKRPSLHSLITLLKRGKLGGRKLRSRPTHNPEKLFMICLCF